MLLKMGITLKSVYLYKCCSANSVCFKVTFTFCLCGSDYW